MAVAVPVEVAPALHVYDAAPLAVSIAAEPRHIVGEFTVVIGAGFTVTVATAVDEQPAEVPVTVYEVVVTGEASAVVTPVDVAPALQV